MSDGEQIQEALLPPAPAPSAGKAHPVQAVVSTFGAVVAPIQEFLRLETASAILLFGAAIAALVWANSPASASYQAFFESPLVIQAAGRTFRFTLRSVLNEGLMALFFFVVGMEIKRELVGGELRTLRRALLPAIAAVGGMVVPSAIFLLGNAGKPGQAGWGIPMATDIAFAIGCLRLLGSRIPAVLVVFLTALAIFDDIGGIVVIALFYGHGISAAWLLGAAGIGLVLLLINRAGVRHGPAYLVSGVALWYAFHQGGIHATIAGVVVGLLVPARPRRHPRRVLEELNDHTREVLSSPIDGEADEDLILHIEEKLEDLESPLRRFLHALHPWVAFGIMPLFALANSGVRFAGMGVDDLAGAVVLGTAAGLALGKPLGIVGATFLAVKTGLAELPPGFGWRRLLGVSLVAGIGFTVALFIGGLAYPALPAFLDHAKVGILMGSLVAGVAGVLVLRNS
jgi:NhaA family Na+:H+ antiporter